MIETYKIVTGKENVNRENFSQMVTELLRGEKNIQEKVKKGIESKYLFQGSVSEI